MKQFSTVKSPAPVKCQHKWKKARDVTLPAYWSNMSISYLCITCQERVISFNHEIKEIEDKIKQHLG